MEVHANNSCHWAAVKQGASITILCSSPWSQAGILPSKPQCPYLCPLADFLSSFAILFLNYLVLSSTQDLMAEMVLTNRVELSRTDRDRRVDDGKTLSPKEKGQGWHLLVPAPAHPLSSCCPSLSLTCQAERAPEASDDIGKARWLTPALHLGCCHSSPRRFSSHHRCRRDALLSVPGMGVGAEGAGKGRGASAF